MTQAALIQAGRPRDSDGARLRLASRASAAFLLDLVHLCRSGRDVLDALLLATIVDANVAEITRRADLQVAYAEAGAVPPDELRRPISCLALANSLGLPFETVRRRAKRLVADGLCLSRPAGLVVPAAQLDTPAYHEIGRGAYARARAFYRQLAGAGLLADLPAPSVVFTSDAFPLRAMARLTTEFALRTIENLLSVTGDVLDALMFLEVFRQNVERLPFKAVGGASLEARDMTPDDSRTPVSPVALAARLGLPRETVRRRAAALTAKGVLERRSGGLIVPAQVLGGPAVQATIIANATNLQRLFGRLATLGVLALWDQDEAPPEPAVDAVETAR